MSEPKRYDLITTVSAGRFSQSDLVESKDGNIVFYEDYVRLKAKIERLTKVGDELERVLTSRISSYEVGNASHEWRSAKGVQS